MLLNHDDLVAKKINWNDKVSNLRELASELNLGLDSIVFVDDSSFEIGLIQKELPQIMCIQVPQNLSEYPDCIRKIGLEFFSRSTTAEDARKTELYQSEKLRKQNSGGFASIDEYLASLDLKINIVWDSKITIARAAQLTQKTNQFNLTTKRYTEADISRMLGDSLYSIVTFSVEDRYGDYGITGLMILHVNSKIPATCAIDSFMMSCRIIGRKIEFCFFDRIIMELKKKGIKYLQAEYLVTSKNSQVAQFYDLLGFNLVEDTAGFKKYHLDIYDYQPVNIPYIVIN